MHPLMYMLYTCLLLARSPHPWLLAGSPLRAKLASQPCLSVSNGEVLPPARTLELAPSGATDTRSVAPKLLPAKAIGLYVQMFPNTRNICTIFRIAPGAS
eukprot:5072975-Pleurochrysis_carterae.AAC.1